MQSGLKPLGRERWWVLLLLTPTLVGLIFGAFGSILATMGLSLFKWDLLTPPVFNGLDNFKDLATDDSFLKALSNTFRFSFIYVPLVIVLSLFVAMLLNRKIRGVSLFRVIYFLPVISSAVSVGLVWLWIYSKDTGLLNYIVVAMGGEPVRWQSAQNALFAVIIVNVWGAIGEGMIIFLAGLQSIPKDYYEAAQVDGATEWHLFRHITLPLITPSIFFQTIISTINAFQAFEFIYVLTRQGNNSSSTPTLVYSIYRDGFNYYRMGSASAQALVLAAIIFVLTLVYFQLQRRLVFYD
jgi:multiple sugar transport system permease protein